MRHSVFGRLAAALLSTTLALGPALAGGYYGGGPGGASASSVTMGGDVSGSSSSATVTQLNGNAPGGPCAAGGYVSSLDTSARPTCAVPVTIDPPWFSGGAFTLRGISPILASSSTFATNTAVKCTPGVATGSGTVGQMSVIVATAGTDTAYVGVFADAIVGNRHQPIGTAPLFQGSASTAATGYSNISGLNYTMTKGTIYWTCFMLNSTTASLMGLSANSNQMSQLFGIGLSNATSTGNVGLSTTTSAFGTWPSMTGATFSYVNSGTTIPIAQFSIQ